MIFVRAPRVSGADGVSPSTTTLDPHCACTLSLLSFPARSSLPPRCNHPSVFRFFLAPQNGLVSSSSVRRPGPHFYFLFCFSPLYLWERPGACIFFSFTPHGASTCMHLVFPVSSSLLLWRRCCCGCCFFRLFTLLTLKFGTYLRRCLEEQARTSGKTCEKVDPRPQDLFAPG